MIGLLVCLFFFLVLELTTFDEVFHSLIQSKATPW